MVRRSPSSHDITTLIAALASHVAVERDSAAARLTILGSRAETALTKAAADSATPLPARVGALRTLGAIGGPQVAHTAVSLLSTHDDALSLEAMEVLGGLVRGSGPAASQALDALTGLVLDPMSSTHRRLSALAALDGLPASLLQPLRQALGRDSSAEIRDALLPSPARRVLDDMVERGLPDVGTFELALRDDGDATSITTLRKLVDLVRAREGAAAPPDALRWMTARGQLHQALAARGSRVAVYDLRETLERGAQPLPVGLLAAAAAVGDVTCLEGTATAWLSADTGDPWYRDQLAEVFRAIVTREGVTRQHPTLGRLLTKHPTTAVLVATAPRKTRVSTTSRTRA